MEGHEERLEKLAEGKVSDGLIESTQFWGEVILRLEYPQPIPQISVAPPKPCPSIFAQHICLLGEEAPPPQSFLPLSHSTLAQGPRSAGHIPVLPSEFLNERIWSCLADPGNPPLNTDKQKVEAKASQSWGRRRDQWRSYPEHERNVSLFGSQFVVSRQRADTYLTPRQAREVGIIFSMFEWRNITSQGTHSQYSIGQEIRPRPMQS